jgi:serine phosphatase RsbU (regulator of sigma subunit)
VTPPEYDSEQTASPRRQTGTGLAARFTLRLGLMTLLIAVVAGVLFLQGAEKLNRDAAAEARLDMAVTSSAMLARRHQMSASPLPEISGRHADAGYGAGVSYAKGPVALGDGQEELRIYQLKPGEGIPTVTLFAPAVDDSDATDQLLVLVILVLGGLVIMTVVFGAMTARRVAEPLRTMIDDVMAISRGRYDRHIHAEGAASEVAFLARAVDRMVHDLVEGQETQRKLDKSQREAESMRELRRNLQPMTVSPPTGFSISTCLIEAAGAGTGDFVDAMTDTQGFCTLVVGSTATRGMPGALLMAMTRAYLRGAVLQGGSPAEACESTNTSLNRDLAEGLYASAMVARLNPESELIELVSSGHKAPAIRWDAEHEEFRKIQPNGIALGFDEGPVFRRSLETAQIQLHSGDALFLFSPGAFECTNAKGKKLGESGVYQLARYAIEHDLKSMEAQLLKYIGGKPRSDLAFALLRDVRSASA